MHVAPPSKRLATLIIALLLLCTGSQAIACSKTSADRAVESSNMRQVILSVVTRYAEPNANYHADRYQTMEDFLKLMTRVDLIDSSLFFNRIEFKEFESTPPKTIGSSIREVQPAALDPEFLKYPVGYSVAIYPTFLGHPGSRTPLLWTRDLHLFREFDKPYAGFIAYLDGHVSFYQGNPNEHDPELLETFNENAPSAQAIRILKHVPDGWVEQAPLPIRFAYITKETFVEKFGLVLFLFIPAIICGLLAAIFSNKEQHTYQRVVAGIATFLIVLLLAAILVPAVC